MTVACTACVDHVVRRLPYDLAREIRSGCCGYGGSSSIHLTSNNHAREIIHQLQVFGSFAPGISMYIWGPYHSRLRESVIPYIEDRPFPGPLWTAFALRQSWHNPGNQDPWEIKGTLPPRASHRPVAGFLRMVRHLCDRLRHPFQFIHVTERA
jgi:hypothetical protein